MPCATLPLSRHLLRNRPVVPRDSAWFSWYGEDGETVLDMKETALYKEDWIGLKALDEVTLARPLLRFEPELTRSDERC